MNSRQANLVDSLPLAMEREINQLCREFEQAWRAGQSPRIEDFAGRMSGAAYAGALRELIAVEVDLRWSAGQSAEPDEYHQRFPQHSQAVAAAFALLEDRRPSTMQPPDTESVLAENAPETDNDRQPAKTKCAEPEVPERLGRFEIERLLGRGAFGAVYLARDGQLNRRVALKVPHRERFSTPEELDHFIEEARTAAQLTHPGIVTIYDVGRAEDQVFIVQEYIEGQDLEKYLKAQTPLPMAEQTARLMTAIAEAVAFANQKGFVHRDLKPANILLDSQQRPRVADFGVAVHENIQRRRRGDRSGTPAYMSPEQVRGETHRLDGRSDIWSLGVILYEMLTGRRPFSGDRRSELYDEIKNRDPKPPRQIQQQVPTELERICLKCLAKRVTDRYTSALDLASDLQHWLAGGHHPSGAGAESKRIKIVPKGLRSFDEGDADFFLELLPGPRDRDGLPESIRFWKTRLEETDADRTFAVGLVYGPSGCGKSSLVKAGLLPRLASHVLPIYVEATAADTEVRLLKGLRKACPEIPADVTLPDVFESLREGIWLPRGRKIVIVLDQFEQWLHARQGETGDQLIQALRHCDGGRVQCLFLVRDDFWLATSRFLMALEIDLLERQNCLLVDLFDPLHARWVLTEFGRAFGRIPQDAAGLAADQDQAQERFLDRAVEGLAQEGKVICIRLAVFADMLKGKPWNTASLEQVGGAAGLGMTFLDETFSAATAPAEHRLHQQAARAVLKALLPESGTNIKGGKRSYNELLEVSGYAQRPREFRDLLRILDSELRLITPAEGSEGSRDESRESRAEELLALDSQPSTIDLFYQLTHDYLVRSLREWLTRKQKETRRGRAELRLAERAALWNGEPESRHLPAWWEYLSIVGLTPRMNWTEPQRKMMRKAALVHGVRSSILAVMITVAASVGWWYQHQRAEQQSVRIARLAQTRREVSEALQTAKTLNDLGWKQTADPDAWQEILLVAFEALKRAQGSLATGETTDELRGQVRALETDLQRANDVCGLDKDIDESLETLLEAGPTTDSFRVAALRFPEIFKKRGIDVMDPDRERIIKWVREHPLGPSLMVVLMAWNQWTPDDAHREQISAIHQAVDPAMAASYSRWVTALAWGDKAKLAELANHPDVTNLPPKALVLMGIAMRSPHPAASALQSAKSWLNAKDSMTDAGILDEAIVRLKQWQFQHPDDFWLNLQLGVTLLQTEPPRASEAITYLVAAVALRQRNYRAYYFLGRAYHRNNNLDYAISALDKASSLNPHYDGIPHSLGNVHQAKGDWERAITAHRKAIELNPPGHFGAHNGLGVALASQGLIDEAITAHRKAIEIKANDALGYYYLGRALSMNHQFAPALAALKQSRQIGSKSTLLVDRTAALIREMERMVQLESQLPALLNGEFEPAIASERADFARLCLYTKHYAASTRLFRKAFEAVPSLAELEQHRYNAACAAAQAGTGKGQDEPTLDETQRVEWRKQALEWLQAELAMWTQGAESIKPQDRVAVQQKMAHWRQDPDLASIRDTAELEKLPNEEQALWRKFWQDVDVKLTIASDSAKRKQIK